MSALLIALLSSVLVLVVPASPSQAFTPFQCDGAGTATVDTSGATPAAWSLQGSGACTGAFGGPWIASMTGNGVSASTGLCGGSGVVTDLSIDVALTVTSQSTGAVLTFDQEWFAPVTTYPLATPFLVSGDSAGAGFLSTRIFLNCPDAGNDGARFAWVFRESA